MTDKILEQIRNRFSLKEEDAGEFAEMKAAGMKFSVRAFTAEGLGHVSVMRAKGLAGLMKMDTLMITPLEEDLPLYSYDRIFVFGKDTLIAELYDTVLGDFSEEKILKEKEKYVDLAERDPGKHWYDPIRFASSLSKKEKKKKKARMDELALAHLNAYFASSAGKTEDREAKKKKTRAYVDGLLTNGGPSTDVFLKAFGKEKTALLFKRTLFGVED